MDSLRQYVWTSDPLTVFSQLTDFNLQGYERHVIKGSATFVYFNSLD